MFFFFPKGTEYTVFYSFISAFYLPQKVLCLPSGPNYPIMVRVTPNCSKAFLPRATQFVFHMDISVFTVVGENDGVSVRQTKANPIFCLRE